ncbi:MAG: hypothetical protein JO211_04035 [Acidobacteriaceae bacterium]|nr:hypothetical protein [Acidobacteriaceae bacterium]
MRRLLAIILLSLASLGQIAPLFAADSEAQLPPCCRANGKHKCSMRAMARMHYSVGSFFAGISEKCPFSSLPVGTTARNPHVATAPLDGRRLTAFVNHAAMQPEHEAQLESIATRAHQQRGPPSFLA